MTLTQSLRGMFFTGSVTSVAGTVVGVVGVLAVCAAYLSFFWPLLWRWPALS